MKTILAILTVITLGSPAAAHVNECSGQPPMPDVPTLFAKCDLDGDPECTGKDIEKALIECGQLGGCIVHLDGRTYKDVAIVFGNDVTWPAPHNCRPENTSCFKNAWKVPNGLTIEGEGASTVVQSPVWEAGYDAPYPVFRFYYRPDIRFRIRDLVIDGRKQEQRPGAGPTSRWHHMGVHTDNWNASPLTTNACVHGVTVKNFQHSALSFSGTDGLIVEDSRVEDVGCLKGVTECPLLDGIPDPFPFWPGYKMSGYGINLVFRNTNVTIRRNKLWRVTKYTIGLKGWGGHKIDGAKVLSNDLYQAGSSPIYAYNVTDSRFTRNRIHGSVNPVQNRGGISTGFAFNLGGEFARNVVADNTSSNLHNIGLRYEGWGSGNVIERNVFSSLCNGDYFKPPGGTFLPAILFAQGAQGSVLLKGNFVQNNLCYGALGMTWLIKEATGGLDVTIDGGQYAGGPDYSGVVGEYVMRVFGNSWDLKNAVKLTGFAPCLEVNKNNAGGAHVVIGPQANFACPVDTVVDSSSTVVDLR